MQSSASYTSALFMICIKLMAAAFLNMLCSALLCSYTLLTPTVHPTLYHALSCSYRQQFKRLRGLLDLQPPQPTLLKGAAVCYNPASGNLVSYNARQRMLSVQSADGQVRSQVVNVQGDGTAHKPLLASSGSGIVVLAAFDGALQVRLEKQQSTLTAGYLRGIDKGCRSNGLMPDTQHPESSHWAWIRRQQGVPAGWCFG